MDGNPGSSPDIILYSGDEGNAYLCGILKIIHRNGRKNTYIVF